MTSLKEMSHMLWSWCLVFAIVWFVFGLRYEIAILNDYLVAIEAKMPDANRPSVVTVSGLPVLSDALRPCNSKKDTHR